MLKQIIPRTIISRSRDRFRGSLADTPLHFLPLYHNRATSQLGELNRKFIMFKKLCQTRELCLLVLNKVDDHPWALNDTKLDKYTWSFNRRFAVNKDQSHPTFGRKSISSPFYFILAFRDQI